MKRLLLGVAFVLGSLGLNIASAQGRPDANTLFIVVKQRGGNLGLDRLIEVRNGYFTVFEKGQVVFERSLTPQELELCRNIAVDASRGTVRPYTGDSVSDNMTTQIDILLGDGLKSLRFQSADAVSHEIMALLAYLGALMERQGPL